MNQRVTTVRCYLPEGKLKKLFWLLLIVGSVVACTSANAPATSTQAAVPTESEGMAEQESDTGPEEYKWEASPVLISLQSTAGFTLYDYAWGLTPHLLVFSDGRVFGTQWQEFDSRLIWQATIPPAEVCNLLLQVESAGFFDFRQSDYVEPGVTDSGTTHITVQAWRTNSISAYALEFALVNDDEGYEPVSPTLAETYRLLSEFQPANAQPYQPERIGLLIDLAPTDASDEIWPLSNPSLNELFADDSTEVVIDGQEATEVYTLFEDSYSKIFLDGETKYWVVARPLFPHEIW
ncbi:MAG: hypothetical protein L0322_31270, partial [Chloroflexi bacterium]|nr:hypothetical protein [Chloroflexota bacterium]